MGRRIETVTVVLGVIAAVGSAVLIALGHRPWYAWVTLVGGIGNVWMVWRLRAAERAAGAEGEGGGYGVRGELKRR